MVITAFPDQMRGLITYPGLLAAIFLLTRQLQGQVYDDDGYMIYSDSVLLEKEMSLGFILHSSGWGIEFRKGKNVSAF